MTKPLNGGGTRARQLFFVNGRFVKEPAAHRRPGGGLPQPPAQGQIPRLRLHITPAEKRSGRERPSAKTVVKFQNERAVFDAVHYTVKDLLTAGEKPAPKPVQQTFYQSMTVQEYKAADTPRRKSTPWAAIPPGW